MTALILHEDGKRPKEPNAQQLPPGRKAKAEVCVPSPKRRRTQSSTKPLPLPGHRFGIALPHNYLPMPPAHPFPTINY